MTHLTNKGEELICPNCGNPAVFTENKEIYGRNYGKWPKIYLCRDCKYSVGCHHNTSKPLGTMISREHAKYRRAVHAKIDPLWQSGKIPRRYVYARISKALGYTYHTGESDVETCKKVLALDIENL